MVLEGSQRFVWALCLWILLSAPTLGLERVCRRVNQNAAFGAADLRVYQLDKAHLAIGDPLRQVNEEKPFSLALSDDTVHERFQAIHRSLEADKDRVKVVLDEWNTWVIYYSQHPEHFTAVEVLSPARLIFVLQHPLDENPELMFQGVITQILFDRLPRMKGNYEKVFIEGTKRLLNVVKEELPSTPLSDVELAYQIHETVKLRMTWIQKVRFYASYIRANPWLASARLNQGQNILAELEKLDGDYQDSGKYDQELLRHFLAFYSHNISQHLEPEVVNAVWHVPLSGLWESSLLFPNWLEPL